MSVLSRRVALTAIPLVGASALGIGFWRMLGGMGSGQFDPRLIATPAVGRLVPDFVLPGFGQARGFDTTALKTQTMPVLLNFFASWCIPCIEEAKALAFTSARIPVWGIAYKDKPEDARGFLERSGNPYTRLAQDQDGDAAINFGVSGVPETFLIMPGGQIAWHDQGGLTTRTYSEAIAPVLTRAGYRP